MMKRRWSAVVAAAGLACGAFASDQTGNAAAVETGFTYKGELRESGRT